MSVSSRVEFPEKVLKEMISIICLETPVILPASDHIDHTRRQLALVCRSWNKLINETPAFWDNIMFTPVPFRFPHSTSRQLSVFREYIRRAGGNPLSFYFSVDPSSLASAHITHSQLPPCSVYGQGRIKIINEIIRPNIQQIRYLRCILIGQDNAEFLLNIPPGEFRGLQSIDIEFMIDPRSPEHHKISKLRRFELTALSSLPDLRIARFSSLAFDSFHPLDLRVSWDGLTTLDFKGVMMAPEVFIRIVTRAKILVSAFFHICPHAGSRASTLSIRSLVKPITLTYMRNFHIRVLHPRFYPELLDLFVLPALEELWFEVDDPIKPYIWDLVKLRKYLGHCSHTLQKLYLSDVTIMNVKLKHRCIRKITTLPTPSSRVQCAQHMVDLFTMLPGLRALTMPPEIHFHISTLERIGDGTLLPRLQFLGLGTHHPDVVRWMIRLRGQNASVSGSTASSLRPHKILTIDMVLPCTQESITGEIGAEMATLGLFTHRVRSLPSCSCLDCVRVRLEHGDRLVGV